MRYPDAVPPSDPGACCGSEVREYTQCRMDRKVDNGLCCQTAWIPSEFAVVDHVVKIRDRITDTWEDGWVIRSVGKSRLGRDKNESVLCECSHFDGQEGAVLELLS